MRQKFWAFVGLYFVPLVTVLAGLIVVVLQYINPPWFEIEYTLAAILGLLVLTATSEIVERARLLTKLETRVEKGFEDVLKSLNANDQEVLVGVDQIYGFWSEQIGRLTQSFDSVSMNPRFSSPSAVSSFRKKATKVIGKSQVRRRYIVVFHDLQTLERIEKDLQEYPPGTFFVGYFEPGDVPFPMISFAIGDGAFVTYGGYYRPHESPGAAINILSRNRATTELFCRYFESLWQKATMLNPGYIRSDLIEVIRARLESELLTK